MDFLQLIIDPIDNSVTVIADQGETLTLNCSTNNPNLTITWVQTLNKAGLYIVNEDSRIHLINNGYDLEFDYIVPADEEYYFCGVINYDTGSFQTINKYQVYVRSKNQN